MRPRRWSSRRTANAWPYDPVGDYGVSRTEFELWVVGVIGTIVLLGVAFYYLGASTRADAVAVPLAGHESEAGAFGD